MLEKIIKDIRIIGFGLFLAAALEGGCATLNSNGKNETNNTKQRIEVRVPAYERIKNNDYAIESYVKEVNKYEITNKQIADDAKKEENVIYGPPNMIEIWW